MMLFHKTKGMMFIFLLCAASIIMLVLFFMHDLLYLFNLQHYMALLSPFSLGDS